MNYLIYTIILFILQLVRTIDPSQDKLMFMLSYFLFSIFIVYKMIGIRKIPYFYIQPVFLASLVSFMLSYAITNIFVIPEVDNEIKFINPYQILNNAIIYASIGFAGMWIGYESVKIRRFSKKIYLLTTKSEKWLRSSFNVNWIFIYILFLASVFTKLLFISIGMFGFSSDNASLEASIPYIQYLEYLKSADILCLIIVSYNYFLHREKRMTFYFILISCFLFGLLSGMKSAAAIPFITITIVYYVVNKSLNKKFVLLMVASIVVAYILIEPFRHVRYADQSFNNKSLDNIANSVFSAYKNKNPNDQQEKNSTFEAVIKRTNYILDLGKAIEYKDHVGLKKDDPDFMNRILTIPLQAYVPRFVWPTKPREDIGGWFSQNVYGNKNSITSIAMSPIGFLYLAGGPLVIFLGFLAIGFLQNYLWCFFSSGRAGGLVIFFVLFSKIVDITSAYNSIFVVFLRDIPIMLIIQFFIFKKMKYSKI